MFATDFSHSISNIRLSWICKGDVEFFSLPATERKHQGLYGYPNLLPRRVKPSKISNLLAVHRTFQRINPSRVPFVGKARLGIVPAE
jgi:hypothetical protein